MGTLGETETKSFGNWVRSSLCGNPLVRFAVSLVCLTTLLLGAPLPAAAFCGFYVSGADAKLYNDATVVVLMRDGKTTVMSMQNNYRGPSEDFAMVVPVPVVLKKKNVKTLPEDVFERVDKMAAPRLVEYWEQDPCQPPMRLEAMAMADGASTRRIGRGAKKSGLGVKVEAKFDVDEYQIVILSARDSGGLDTWLRKNGYKIPAGAEKALRPYVAAGTKFFVAKVNAKKVRFRKGKAVLSPLRFHFDAKEFRLPVRLGLLNSSGKQDLLVHILARGQRYEVANYKNVFIPTNIDVSEATRKRFGEFYAALFDKVLAKNPKAVVTEYAWDAGSCDPCPIPPLNAADLMTLGADVVGFQGKPLGGSGAAQSRPGRRPVTMPSRPMFGGGGFVLTRLHARYSRDVLGEDLIFKAVPPVAGGREFFSQGDSQRKKLEEGARSSSINNFQARYAIRHAWAGAIKCKEPQRGIWGGPPGGGGLPGGGGPKPLPAIGVAAAPRGKMALSSFLQKPIPELGLSPAKGPGAPQASGDQAGKGSKSPTPSPKDSKVSPGSASQSSEDLDDEEEDGCRVASKSTHAPFGAFLFLVFVGLLFRRTGFASRARRRP